MNPFRWMITKYRPNPEAREFVTRAEQRAQDDLSVRVAVFSDRESKAFFDVPLARRGVQPVWIEVKNDSAKAYRLDLFAIDPGYYTPLEAAAICHFSVGKRLLSFGILGWVFLILLPLLPTKLISAAKANNRMNLFFKEHGFRFGPIQPGGTREGIVFTSLDEGLKNVRLRFLHNGSVSQFDFSVEVPGLLVRNEPDVVDERGTRNTTVAELMAQTDHLAACTSGKMGTREGDPLNLIVVGNRDLVRQCFGGRWDDAEAITFGTCLKTTRAFLFDSSYRYSPVSSLYVDGRIQDLALQRARTSINERIHLRLWQTEMRIQGQTVWIGQVSRDIGVRFTLKTWNLTTHRIDPDVDEARDYVVDSLIDCRRVVQMAYVPGVGKTSANDPRHNLTGDPYFTDGKRALLVLSPLATDMQYLEGSEA